MKEKLKILSLRAKDAIMITVSDEILAEMVQTIVREVDPERIYLFGSRARGNERADSDVDR